MTYLLYYWLILALIFLIFEMINPGLFLFLSVSMGSVGAFVSGLFNVPLQQQLSIFFASFVITFIVLTVWLRQFQKHSIPKSLKTNIFALYGTQGIVTQQITPLEKGYIQVQGQFWLAQSAEYCPVGALVEIISITGCHCVVKLVNVSK